MKSLYRVSYMNGDESCALNVLADSPEQANAHAGNPTTGLATQIMASHVEIAGVDKPHKAPKEPHTIVIGPPQNVPLQPAEIDRIRKILGGEGALTQEDIDKIRNSLDTSGAMTYIDREGIVR